MQLASWSSEGAGAGGVDDDPATTPTWDGGRPEAYWEASEVAVVVEEGEVSGAW
jgi:hypothetical protein